MAAAWFALGEVRHRLKDEPKSLEAYQKAAALDGSWAGVHMGLADALVRAGPEQLQAAINEYDLVQQLSLNENEQARAKKWATTLRKQLK